MLKDWVTNDLQATKDLDKIISNTIFSREVVKKLMFFACEMPQEKEIINIVPVIEDAIDLMQTTLRQNKITCQLSIKSTTILLRIDKIQLTQVLFNIIVNAIYFSPENSTITVEVLEKKDTIILKISDEGTGVSTEKAVHIFEPFYTTKPIGEGSGLGLSVVHGIVQSHQGKIYHSQNKPRGTIFSIEFPKK